MSTFLGTGATDIGRKRKTNQDSICLYPKRNLFAVADGMGGHNGGDIASQMAAKLFPEFVESHTDLPTDQLLKMTVQNINQSIYNHGQENSELKGMGTTISGIMYDTKGMVYVANIGDSRTYLINNKKIYLLSRDHSLVQEKLNLGIYNREEAKADPQKNVLIRTVGFEPKVDVDIYQYKTFKNDLFMVCSDGLHGKVSDEDILTIINKNLPDLNVIGEADLLRTAKALIAQANENGGQDNISVVMALVKD